VLVSSLIERTAALRRRLAESELEVQELESLREALTAPELPSVEGLTIATSYTPAEGLVAGDFFLVAPGPRGTALVVVGDVVGHGLAAARRAAFVRATIALYAEYTSDPMTILRLANTALAEREPGTEFVTALCAIFAADRATVTWASAGHPPPWDVDRAEPLPQVGRCLPLGVEPALEGDAMTARLTPGSGVLLFTDGLPEARTARKMAHHELFGEQATRETLRTVRGAPPEAIVAALRAAAVTHAEGTPADDLCLVAVRFDGSEAAQPQAA
jgi:serine phosphatase RsbU (regulator of sigma subunit)